MTFKYVSLFSGIGGFEQALNKLGGQCQMASEIDKFANQAYEILYGHKTVGDVKQVAAEDVPDHDLLVGGFPCQAFSVAGKRRGFEDTRGTLFFEIARIAKVKRPKAILMENVKGLISHDKGKTLDTIIQTLAEIGYTVDFNVLNSKYFGVPQNRERIFIVAVRDDLIESSPWVIGLTSEGQKRTDVVAKGKRRISALAGVKTFNFDWPEQAEVTTHLRDILESNVDEKYYLSDEKTAKLIKQLSIKNPSDISRTLRSGGTTSVDKKHNYLHIAEPQIPCINYNGNIHINLGDISNTIDANYTKGLDKHGQRTHILENEVRPVLTPDRIEKRQNGRRFKDNGEESFTLTAQDRHGVAIGQKEGFDACEKERNTIEILRVLREEVGEKAIAEWRFRVLDSLQSSKVLRQELYGYGVQGTGTDGRSGLVHSPQTSKKDKGSGYLREMWINGECRDTPQGRELEEQFAREFTVIMSELPYEGTSSEESLCHLWETTKGSRLLQQALYKIQEIWRPTVQKTRYRIRKLTPRECFRLQSFPDEAFDKLTANGISNSQLYKMAGNAVTVNVIDAIGRRLLTLLDDITQTQKHAI